MSKLASLGATSAPFATLLRGPTLSLLVLVCALSACKPAASPSASQTAPAAPPVVELLPSDVIQVQAGELTQTLRVSGNLRALEQVNVKARVAGEVKQVLVREGEAVKEGQVLLRMEQADYLARVEQARSTLRAAQGQLDIANNTRNNNRQLQRNNFISKNALDTAESQYAIAQANLESAKAALQLAQKSLQDTVLYAPMSGTVSVRSVQPGEKISPDLRLLEILDLRQMEMELAIPANEITRVKPGQHVVVEVDGMSIPHSGSIVRISPATQAASRTVTAWVRLDNPQQLLRAGMFAQASVQLQKQSQVLTLPSSALYRRTAAQSGSAQADTALVYVLENGILRAQPVQLGVEGENAQGGAVEIRQGLQAGMQVVKTNLGELKPGTKVVMAVAKPLPVKPATTR